MSSEKWGEINEKRVLHMVRVLARMYPRLVKSIRRSTQLEDARGIDCFVEIRLPKGSSVSTMLVPMQIKSSAKGVAKWRVTHPKLHRAGVLVFSLPAQMSNRQIGRLIYRALNRVQIDSKDGTLYHSVFQALSKQASKRLLHIAELVKKNRTR